MEIQALPTILSRETSHPVRESVLLLRLSPMTKYSFAGITPVL
jgi:hypothetical protein